MATFKELVQKRRSQYAIGKNTDLTNDEIIEYITQITKEVPSANNMQTTRIAIVFGDKNEKLWDHILEVQEKVMAEKMWEMMSGVMQGAKAGIGTIIFFEDLDAVDKMPTSPARTEVYKQNNNANVQYATWLGLTELGLGGSLQHMNVGYEQGFDKSVKELLGLPERWEMQAQMPFGSIEGENKEKTYIDDNERVAVVSN